MTGARESATDTSTLSCCDCGTWQRLPELAERATAFCYRCRRALAHTSGRSASAALACSVSALMLLIPAYLMPLLEIPLGGATQQLYLTDAIAAAWSDGLPLLTAILAGMLVVFPLGRLSLLSAVLCAVMAGRRLPHAGPLFRWAEELRLWSTLDVFVVALGAVYLRLNVQLTAEVGPGGWALAAAAALGGFASGALDHRRVWNVIMPDRAPAPAGGAGCEVCELPAAEGERRCPRCGLTLARRRVLSRTTALVVASLMLYVPSYLYPMSSDIRPTGRADHTILSGIDRLIGEGFWTFAALIIVASILIPAAKLLGLAWLVQRCRVIRERGRVARTRLHRIIHEIGPWSMIDPFIAAGTAGLVALSGVAEVHVGPAATPFALVVVLTMLGSRVFDPRLMWRRAS